MKPTLSDGNPKIGEGPDIRAFSLSPGPSCPGASSWCAEVCYAKRPYRQYVQTRNQWDLNLELLQAGAELPEIGPRVKAFRIHVSGDFFSAAYIRKWTQHVQKYPAVQFWAYTRSWRRKRLLPALDLLRTQPNVQLFASTDPTIQEKPPAGWRLAFIAGDTRYAGLPCPEQDQRQESCLSCGYCFRGQRGNVAFKAH